MEILDYTQIPTDFWTIYLGEALLTLDKEDNDCITSLFTNENDAQIYCDWLTESATNKEQFRIEPISFELVQEKALFFRNQNLSFRLRFVVRALREVDGRLEAINLYTLADNRSETA